MSAEGSFQRLLQRMQQLGFQPSRRLGQNFLLDPTLHRVIAEAAGLGRTDVVLEVGPGLGFLTRELAQRAGHVVAVEIDPRLASILREELLAFAPEWAPVEVVEGDVLAPEDSVHAAALAAVRAARARLGGGFAVVANLPYAASGPFLARLPLLVEPPERAVLLVQRELAERLTAAAGGRDYGSLPALLSGGYRIERLRKVGREVFRPRPQVDSAIVRLVRNPDGPLWDLDPSARRLFSRWLRGVYAGRRKQLRSGLLLAARQLGWPEPDPREEPLAARRIEELDAATCLQLFSRQHRPF